MSIVCAKQFIARRLEHFEQALDKVSKESVDLQKQINELTFEHGRKSIWIKAFKTEIEHLQNVVKHIDEIDYVNQQLSLDGFMLFEPPYCVEVANDWENDDSL